MSFSYLFDPNKQFQDRNGVNNVGGFLRVYIDGTDDRATTYKDFNGTLNEADIMLDTDGRAVVIVDDSFTFRIEVYSRDGSLLWTVTNFTARGEGGGGGSSTHVVVDGTANEIDVTESMTAGVKYYTIGLATVVKNTLLGLLASLSNLVGLLNSKADKVQGATAGNLAAIDASGNLTDSGSKAADFKTKQTPVPDPSASGAGLEFIDSISQDANGEITPHKKSVQDGTTAQKGVLQLQDSIGSTESATDKAVTPHAVREAINAAVSSAYHAAGTKTVAQLTSSLLVAENEGCVYNVTDSGTTTSDFVDGAGHPINAGDNVGVCDVGGGVYKFDLLSGFVDLSNYLTKTGDASNTTSTFTKASGDTSTMASGSKLSAIFTAISSIFASLKVLAFKDKVSDSDINGTISDSHIASASTWNDKQNSLGINSSIGDTGKFLNERGAFATPNYPSVPSVIDNLTSTNTTDALSAAQGKALNDKLTKTTFYGQGVDLILSKQMSVYDSDAACFRISYARGNNYYYDQLIYIQTPSAQSDISPLGGGSITAITNSLGAVLNVGYKIVGNTIEYHFYAVTSGNSVFRVYAGGGIQAVYSVSVDTHASDLTNLSYNKIYMSTYSEGGKGSPTTPVYVDSNGQVQPCNPSQMGVGAASYAEKAKEGCKGNNTATLYIAGTFEEGNIPYYNVKDIKNGCVNYVHVKDIPSNTCSITIEAPALASGEEYDYVVVFDTFTNSNLVGSIDVENCKKAGRFENNVFVVDSMALTSGNPRYVPMIVVTGNVASSKWYERL